MIYSNLFPAFFLSRPNRFLAHVLLDGKETVCHVKNTGRCKELLLPGAKVMIQKAENPARRTGYDLISVEKDGAWVNVDSMAPNRVFEEYLTAGGLGFIPEKIRPECVHGDSRFDFYYEGAEQRGFAEVKGVTLAVEGAARFPDAPTVRGVKHLEGLIRAKGEGYDARAVFIIAMGGVNRLEPNWETHPAFGLAMRRAKEAGVELMALSCTVTADSLAIRDRLPVTL